MTKPGLAELFNRIRGVMLRDRCPEDRALAVVFAEIRSDPAQLQRWWDALGDFWLQATIAYVWDHGGPDKLGIRMTAPTPNSPPVPAPAVAVRSWREDVNPLDMVIPTAGLKKRLGDFTSDDVRVMAAYYQANGQKLIEEGRRWRELAAVMHAGETLEALLERIDGTPVLPAKLLKAGVRAGVDAAVEVA
jgi:hypothetical protein